MPESIPPILLDTSAWIRFMHGDEAIKAAIGPRNDADIFTHPLVLAELRTASLRGRTKSKDIVEEVEALAILQDLTRDDALAGAATWVRLRKAGRDKVGLVDCLIHATARRVGATLVTCDADMRREPGVLLASGD